MLTHSTGWGPKPKRPSIIKSFETTGLQILFEKNLNFF